MNTTNHRLNPTVRSLAIAFSCLVLGLPDARPAPSSSTPDQAPKSGESRDRPAPLLERDQGPSDTVTLTPFEVNTSKDVGYAAGNTLSGGRVNTPLALTPGSISVMTKEFMDDFNITNMNQAGGWTVGFDLGTSVPNSDPSSISVYQNIVRGAPSTDNFPTRNGFINFGAADSYNTERYEFQRGPDTSMFGDGGPGGRQGSSSKKATFNKTQTGISTQADTYGGYRETLDYSKGWDRFGLRFNALYQNDQPYQDGEKRIKKAWTINTITKLTENTQLMVEYERINEWNNLWSITNGDAQLSWDGTTVNTNNSSLLGNDNAALVATGLRKLAVEENGGAANMFVYNYATNDLQDYGGNQYRTIFGGFGTSIRIPYVGNKYLLAVPSRRAAIPSINPRFSLAPRDNIAARDGDNTFVTLEHKIGNLFLRFGYTKNDFDNNTIWSNASPNGYVIDVNALLPSGARNPRYLRAFTDVAQNNLYSQDATQEYQGIATYEFAKAKWWDYKQQFSLVLSDRNMKSEARTSAWRRVDNPTQSDPFDNANQLFYRVYWGDPNARLGPIFSNPNGILPGKWAYVDTAASIPGSGNGITKRETKHAGLISQSSFLEEKITLTVSVSRDEVGLDNLPRLTTGLAGSTGAPSYKNLLGYNNIVGNHYKRTETVTSTAFGAVTYPFKNLHEGLLKTILSPLGFVGNVAENNQPPPSGVPAPLLDGTIPTLVHSQTKDFGLRYSIPNGLAYLTLTHYKTTQRNIPNAFDSQADIVNIWTNLGYTDPRLTTAAGFNYSDLSDRDLEGWEAELTANPTRNITLTVNYSHPVTYILKESEDRKAYVAAHRAEWDAGARAAAGSTLNGRTIIDPTIIGGALQNIDNSLGGLATGALENNQVRHRINVAASYRFREGLLRGLGLIAGVQYRGHGKNGSVDPRIKFGLAESATPTAAQTKAAAFDYLWTPSVWKSQITVGANYTHRFWKHPVRFQLNVTNLLDNEDPIWGRSGPVGNFNPAYTTFSQNQLFAGNPRMQVLTSFVNPDPRRIILSTSVEF